MAKNSYLLVFLVVVALTFLTRIGVNRQEVYATSAAHVGSMQFPSGFYWGAAISAQQAESQQPTDWTDFELDAFKSGRFDTGPSPGVAKAGHIHDLGKSSAKVRLEKTGFERSYPQDLAMAKAMGMNAFRFSIDLARLFPRPNMAQPDPAGIAFYKSMLAEMKRDGITPFATMFHFASPSWFFDPDAQGRRGWERADALQNWQQFATTVAESFVPDIVQWCTVNESLVYVYNGYLEGVFPPFERRRDVTNAAGVVESLLRAHVIAYQALHSTAERKSVKVNVWFTKHTRAFEPLRNWSPLDRLTAQSVDQAWNWDFIDAVESGRLKLLNTNIDKPIEGLKGTQDYIGINYYGRFYIKSDIFNVTKPQVLLHDPDANGEPVNDLGWALYPHGFYEVLTKAARRYHKPIYVLENGTADKADNDVERQKFLVSHVRELWLAINQSQADVRSYIHWSLFDNFEWAEGFTARFGLVAVDYAKDFQRTPRPSAEVFAEIANANALSEKLIKRLGGP